MSACQVRLLITTSLLIVKLKIILSYL